MAPSSTANGCAASPSVATTDDVVPTPAVADRNDRRSNGGAAAPLLKPAESSSEEQTADLFGDFDHRPSPQLESLFSSSSRNGDGSPEDGPVSSTSSHYASGRNQRYKQGRDQEGECDTPQAEADSLAPRVTSPPYWSHGNTNDALLPNGTGAGSAPANTTTRHARATSDTSTLHNPRMITLQDNEVSTAGRERGRAAWARDVKVPKWSVVGGGRTGPFGALGMGKFVVYEIRIETLEGSSMTYRKRYSEIDELRRNLVAAFPQCEESIPKMPSKTAFPRFDDEFLEKRRRKLEYLLWSVIANPEFAGSPIVKDFIFAH